MLALGDTRRSILAPPLLLGATAGPRARRSFDSTHHQIGAAGQPPPLSSASAGTHYMHVNGGGILGLEVPCAVLGAHEVS